MSRFNVGPFLCALLFCFSLLASGSAFAASALQVPFNWQAVWGDIAFDKPNSEDPIIPADRHPAKMAIKNAILNYGTNINDLSLEKTYTLEINMDGVVVNGVRDIVLDGSAYFKKYANGASDLCLPSEGCYLTIYIQNPPTNIITAGAPGEIQVEKEVTHDIVVPDELLGGTATKSVTVTETILVTEQIDHVCPATAAANTACDSACPATVDQCPGLFQYNLNTAYDNRVFSWSFISASDFDVWYRAVAAKLDAAAKAAMTGSSIYQSNYIYKIKNTSPVLVVQLKPERCYNEEMIFNNNTCIKYFQYDPSERIFVDIYSHPQYVGGDFGDMYTYSPFDRSKIGGYSRGEPMGAGWGLKLMSGGRAYVQFSSFTHTKKDGSTYRTPEKNGIPEGFASFNIVNNSGVSLFVPTNTDEEFSAFLNNLPVGVTLEPMSYQFTDWYGDLSCPSVGGSTNCAGLNDQMGTGISIRRTAERFCASATSAILPCEVCVNEKVSGYKDGCTTTRICPGLACCIHGVPYAAGSFEACASMIARHCVGEGQRVALPDGKTKAIEEIKAGDVVLGFDKPKGKVKPMKVISLGVTQDEQTINLNGDLSLTLGHKVIKADGKKVFAKDIKVGDSLLRQDKKALKVESVQSQPEKTTVYNLELDKGIGFIVNDVRVTSMPKAQTEKK